MSASKGPFGYLDASFSEYGSHYTNGEKRLSEMIMDYSTHKVF